MRNFLLGAAFLVGASAAQATTVDFNELTPDNFYGSPLESGGLIFSNPGYGTPGEEFLTSMIGGEITLLPNAFGSITTISTIEGIPFHLYSLDFADAFDYADDPLSLTLVFHTLTGDLTEVRTADLAPGLQTEFYNISDIVSISLSASDSKYGEDTVQLKNFVYSLENPADAVPEPATWGVMILGFGMVGLSLRQRRRLPVA